MSDAIASLGTKLQVTISSTLTDIPNNTVIDGPDSAMGVAPTDHLASTIKTKRPTLLDPGTISSTFNYIPSDTVHKFLATTYEAKGIVAWKLLFSDTTFCLFSGFITKLKPSAGSNEDNLAMDLEVTLTTDITWPA